MTDTTHVVCPGCSGVNRIPSSRLGERPVCGRCREALFSGRPVALDERTVDTHIARGDLPVVVDFWAPWCGPCRMMAPAFEQAAATLEPAVRFAKLDTDSAPSIAARFGIQSIPTLALFEGGREVARQPGAMGERDIVRWVESHCRAQA